MTQPYFTAIELIIIQIFTVVFDIFDVKKDPDYFSREEERHPYTAETEVQVGNQDGTTLQHINTEMENIKEEEGVKSGSRGNGGGSKTKLVNSRRKLQ